MSCQNHTTKSLTLRSVASPKSTGKSSIHTSAAKSKKKGSVVNATSTLRSSVTLQATDVAIDSISGEAVLYDQAVALMTILLKSSASRTFHDFNTIQNHIQARAVAAVEEQLQAITFRLSQLRGSSAEHRLTAFAQLLSALTHDVETAVFNVDRRAVTHLRNDQIAARVEAEQQLKDFNERLARRDQTILALQAEHTNLDFKNKSLIRTVELLSKELEKCNSNLTDVHQRSVELRMQALDFKAEVDKRAQRVQQSVQARVGFVPKTIQKHLHQLTALLPPGDANYDRVRMELYRKTAQGPASGSGSAPSTPTSTARKMAALQSLSLQAPGTGGGGGVNSSPRSSFTSSSPVSTTASGSNSPPRPAAGSAVEPIAGHRAAPHKATGIALAASAPVLSPQLGSPSYTHTAEPPSSWTPATSGSEPSLTSSTQSPQRSRLSPTRQSLERRQMLITSLFPRASISLQESTGIADMHLPSTDPAAIGLAANADRTLAAQGSTVNAPAHPHAWKHAINMRASNSNDDNKRNIRSGRVSSSSDDSSSSSKGADSEGSDSSDSDQDSDQDGDEDALETRTNPSVSQYTFSTADSQSRPEQDQQPPQSGVKRAGGRPGRYGHDQEADEQSEMSDDDDGDIEADSTSPGADDEQPHGAAAGQPHGHHHSAAHAGPMEVGIAHRQDTSRAAQSNHRSAAYEHHLPRVSAQHSPHRSHAHREATTLDGAPSESDENGDFFENMKKFLQRFQESQLIDISDSELDGDQRLQEIAQKAVEKTTAAAGKKAKTTKRGGGNNGKKPASRVRAK